MSIFDQVPAAGRRRLSPSMIGLVWVGALACSQPASGPEVAPSPQAKPAAPGASAKPQPQAKPAAAPKDGRAVRRPSRPAPAPAESAAPLVQVQHRAMGTMIHLSAPADQGAALKAAAPAVFAEFDRLEALLTVWRPDSEVSKINRAAGRAPVAVSDDTFEVIRRALQMSELSGGKFDITFGALAEVWRFDHDKDNRRPTAAEVQARLPRVDYRRVKLLDKPRRVFIDKAGVRIHLGGIGKGYAVDRAVARLRAAGLKDFMVQAGGDLYLAGRRSPQAPWRVGIQDPRGPTGQYFALAEVQDATFSTSGDYERFFFQDGRRYHHLLDPDRGAPARGCRSVTILAPEAVAADALSTAVFILGPARGLALVEHTPGAAAAIVTAGNELLLSTRMKGRLQLLQAPTDGP